MSLILWITRQYIKLRNWFTRSASDVDLKPLNTGGEWNKANLDTLIFHWIMKEPMRKFIRMLPDIPANWINGLTGNRKVMYDTIKSGWYDIDGNQERKDKFWKPFLFFLCYWEYDTAGEFIEKALYDVLEQQKNFYFKCDRLDPKNWYYDKNPQNGESCRVMKFSSADPAVAYGTLKKFSDKTIFNPETNLIMLQTKPHNNSIGIFVDGVWQYVVFDKRREIIKGSGLYEVEGVYDNIADMTEHAFRIEEKYR